MSDKSMETCMENMKEVVCLSLRRGDVVARCSPSQFVLMLPQANYADSCMVCQRVIDAFRRRYPHSRAEFTAAIQPIEPTV